MDEILSELSKPVWWISVVVAGIAINLLSAYLKNPIDGSLARISIWWRLRSSARQKAWKEWIEILRSNEEARTNAWMLEMRFQLLSIYLLLLAIFMVLLVSFIDVVVNVSLLRIIRITGFGPFWAHVICILHCIYTNFYDPKRSKRGTIES